MRLISLLFILISFYPTSLLGGSILNGSFSVFTFLFISLIIIIYSLNKLSLKNFKINGDFKPILFTLLFLIILLIVHKDTYLVRECVILIVSFLLFETPQKNTFKNLNFWFKFFALSSVFFLILSYLGFYDYLVSNSNHISLNNRNLYDLRIDYVNIFNILLDRKVDGLSFDRYSAHFLEPGFYWFFLLIYTSKFRIEWLQWILAIYGLALFGLVSLIFSFFILKKNNFKKFFLLIIFIIVFLSIDYSDRFFQFAFMYEKDFFSVPEFSIFGTGNLDDSTRYGLGVLTSLERYGFTIILIMIFWFWKIIQLNKFKSNIILPILGLTFILLSLKVGLLLSHLVLYYLVLKAEIREKLILNNN